MSSAGRLRDRVRFESRGTDANGDPLGAFEARFTVWAELIYSRGSEVAVSNRLEGRQPITLIIRDSTQARTIGEGFRGVILTGPTRDQTINITAVAPAKERGFLSLQGVSGGADG